MTIGKILGVGAALVAGGAVAASIWLNPPSENRARAMDNERHLRLNMIRTAINEHYRLREKLPATLQDLGDTLGRSSDDILDPVTKQPFDYEVVGEKEYRFCAIFERSEDGSRRKHVRGHKAGRNCFDGKVIPSKS